MRTGRVLHQLVLRVVNASVGRAVLEVGWNRIPCAIGRAGLSHRKREGDGATPAGRWPVRRLFIRMDRIGRQLARPRTRMAGGAPLHVARTKPLDGWCDAVADRNYNRFVTHPYPASAEHLWRDDGLYDIVAVLGHNDGPRIRGRGSAIFLHCARPDYAPTAGCVALAREDVQRVLPYLTPRSRLVVGAAPIPRQRLKKNPELRKQSGPVGLGRKPSGPGPAP